MAISISTVWEVRSTGASANGGGFNVGNANFATDGAVSSANTSAPVVSSASYTFVAGDVGALWFGKLGTNLNPGFYPVASVSGGNATLNAAIGAADLYGGATTQNTVVGVSASASLSSITWGMDYSQQASPQFTFTDMVIDGTTNTKFTSAAFPVGKNFVGSILNVTSGTGFTVQRVEVVSTTGTTATCDKSLGTLSSTGGNGKLGGALDGQVTLAAAYAASNKMFVQSGAYTQTAIATFANSATGSNVALPSRIIGYYQRRGDITPTTNLANRPVITLSTNTGLTAINVTGTILWVENLIINCASLGTSTGISLSGGYSEAKNCKVSNFTSKGIAPGTSCGIYNCEVTGGTSAATAAILGGSAGDIVYGCNVHDNACPGIQILAFGVFILDNLVTNNTGASSDGISVQGNSVIRGNTVYGSGRNGIYGQANSQVVSSLITKNLLASNGAVGLISYASGAGNPADYQWDGNAFWNNSGTRSNSDDVGAVNPVNGVAPYVNALDVILTADPFVLKASNDYRLNTTAGGGAACRGFGVPTTWPGNSLTVGAPDMGAVQHVDSGGSGGPVRTNFRGGFSNG